MKNKRYFLSGIGTGVGKTLAAAVLVEALAADYWKPVQTGSQSDWDRLTVENLVSPLPSRQFHPETYALPEPLSPHAAAALAGLEIDTALIQLPETSANLVVEGAGGLLVPLNTKGEFILDLPQRWEIPLVLVVSAYLGNINHTLLSVEALKNRGMSIAALWFNGGDNLPHTESFIRDYTGLALWPSLPQCPKQPDRAWVQSQAARLRSFFNES